jgi:hypothetical protein
MLGRLQDRTGAPRLRVRVLASVMIFGLLLITAPIVVVPIVMWVAHHI